MIEVGEGSARRAIAIRRRQGDASKPTVVWLGGLRSDMGSTKASALDEYCAVYGRSFLRFDYSGHGASAGAFEDGTISRWLEDTLGVLATQTHGPVVLVGSSMGGYLAMLSARSLHRAGKSGQLSAMLLIAPAVDMTERLIWTALPEAGRTAIMTAGRWDMSSDYGPDPYAITRALIEDGRQHLLFGATIRSHCPTIVLQGAKDPDVPLSHTLATVQHMAMDPVKLTIVHDGDHRLSRPQDLATLRDALAALEDGSNAPI